MFLTPIFYKQYTPFSPLQDRDIYNFHYTSFVFSYDLVKEFGEGVDRIFRDMQDAGLPEPEYKQSEFMLYATLKNKTWGLENGSWESLTNSGKAGEGVSEGAGEGADKLKKVLDFCALPRTKAEIQEHLGIKSDRFIRQEVIQPLLKSGKLIRTIPDKPSSPKQKYVKAQ